MSASRLGEQYLPENSRSTFAQLKIDGILVGHAFASHWNCGDYQVCWVTQLVVHRQYRRDRVATMLLIGIHHETDNVFGIMSSHPGACKALARACGGGQRTPGTSWGPQIAFANRNNPGIPLTYFSLDFAREHAAEIMAGSPVSYVRDAQLRGNIFNHDGRSTVSLECGVDSNFYIDHTETNEAVERLEKAGHWSLGKLPDGHEFLVLFERDDVSDDE